MQSANRKNRRVAVRETVGDTAKFQPATPLNSNARSGGAEAAFALAEALKGGIALGNMRNQKMSAKAQTDFQRGLVDDTEDNQAYRRSVESLKAKARWVEDEAHFDEVFEDVDLRNLSLEEFNSAMDKAFAAKYGDLDDPHIAAEVLPKMEAYRDKKVKEILQIQDEAELVEAGAAAQTIAEDAYRKGFDAEGNFQFDYEGLNQQIQGVTPGEIGNETYFNIVKDIAIRNGDVSFLRGVPERWADGTPTFMSNPAFNERVLDAENRAAAEAARIEKKEAEAADAADKEAHRQLTVSAAIKAVHGVNFDEEMEQLLGNSHTDSNDVTSLYAAGRAGLDEAESRSWDEMTVTSIWGGITSGDYSVADVVEIHRAGVLGSGPQSAKLAESMIRYADQNARAAGNDTTATFQNYKSLLNGRYNKQQDGPLAPVSPKMGPLNVEANELYVKLQVEQGLSPREAYDRVVEQFDPVADRIQAGISGMGSQRNAASVHGLSISRLDAKSYLDGNMSLADFIGSRTPDEFLIQIQNSGLPQEELDAVAEKYMFDIDAAQQQ